MGSKEIKEKGRLQKSYFDVLGICCTSEVPLVHKILKSLEGVIEVSVIVPSSTVIVQHDTLLISQLQIVTALNQAQLEANVRVKGEANYKGKWPSPYVMLSGLALSLSFLKYLYHPFHWLALVAVLVGIWPIVRRCFVAVRTFTLDVNILMFIAVAGTVAMRDYTEAGTIVFLFTVAEWLRMRASHKAIAVMSSLTSMAPQKATIAETGEIVDVEDVKLNTIIAVKTGEIIPVDGIVVEGTCEVDQKTLTGESFPVAKQKDSSVLAGTINVNGYINVRTTTLAEDCVVAKMAGLVEEAQNNKSNVQRLIDNVAKYYTPAVVLISAGLAAVPAILSLPHLRHWFHLALVVLVSACPCGLILSTPVATSCSLSRAATKGLLIKGGDYLEILAKLKLIAFDKTGTLTRGEFTVEDFQLLVDDINWSTLLYWVSSIESKSSHPIAAVLVEYACSKSIQPIPEKVEDFQNFPGEGVSGKIDGKQIFIGNSKLGERANYTASSNTGGDTTEGRTLGHVYCEDVLIGTFGLSDNCRLGAKEAIRDLKSMGIKTALLTGDGQSAAMHAQEQLAHGLDMVHAELLPEEKAKIIQKYKQEGKVGMVGDGVNDAPALVTADIGISMGVSGTALANESSHMVLMSNDIRKIPKAIKLARKTRWKVIENIIFSITTKAAVLALAFAGHPLVWLAVVADVVTCLIVILNSMLLLCGSYNGRGKKCHSHANKCKNTSTHHHHLEKKNKQCCSVNKVQIQTPQTCKSSNCCSKDSETSCHTNKCTDPTSELHQHSHDEVNQFSSHGSLKRASDCASETNCCKEKTCHKSVVGNEFNCKVEEKNTIVDIPHDKGKGSSCHSHHNEVSHKTSCHEEGVEKDGCASLGNKEVGLCCKTTYRNKCCSKSQDHFVVGFGGLTEIITE